MTPNYIYWNVDPEIINVIGISIRYYGLLFVSGLIICIYILGWIYKRENIPLRTFRKTLNIRNNRNFCRGEIRALLVL